MVRDIERCHGGSAWCRGALTSMQPRRWLLLSAHKKVFHYCCSHTAHVAVIVPANAVCPQLSYGVARPDHRRYLATGVGSGLPRPLCDLPERGLPHAGCSGCLPPASRARATATEGIALTLYLLLFCSFSLSCSLLSDPLLPLSGVILLSIVCLK